MKNNEPSKNNEAFKKRYFSMMTSRIMHEESKRLSISPFEKEVWGELRDKVRKIVRNNYKTKTFEELLEDLQKYNIKNPFQLSSSTPDERNFADNHDLCYRLLGELSIDKVKWVEHNRRQLLGRASKQLCSIESVFANLGIGIYQRYPFVIDGRVYFSILYIPESKTIIEIDKGYTKGTEEYKEQQARFCALSSVCDKLIVLDNDVYSEKRIKTELVPKCADNVVLGSLGSPMKKIGKLST